MRCWLGYCLSWTATTLSCGGEVFPNSAALFLEAPAETFGEVQGIAPHWEAAGKGGAVATANPLATATAISILKQGGNAADALLAAAWVLAVAEPQSSGLGGGGFLVYYNAAQQKAYALDGREELPANADPGLFLAADKRPLSFTERIAGARAVGVPGSVALLAEVQRRFGSGRFSWRELLQPAILFARNGIRVSPRLALAILRNRERLLAQNGPNHPFLRAGEPYRAGEAFYQRELAGTLELLAEKGPTEFYTGSIARDILATLRNNAIYPSAVTAADLADYRVVERPVASERIAGVQFWTIGAPASGATVLAILRSLPKVKDSTALMLNVLKASKVPLAERERFLGDPDFALAKKPQHEETTQISIVDAAGNALSYTASIEASMGSALVVRGRGFLLNNQLSDFTAEPGTPNSPESGRRLRHALNPEAQIPGGKRPRSAMSPLVFRSNDGKVVALGSPGGNTIIGIVALTAARILNGASLMEAILAPRAVLLPDGSVLAEWPLRHDPQFLSQLARAGFSLNPRKVFSLGAVEAA
ncbi:MAG: gamma-glutamyltransferase, partial [Turneriella sp.]|nr:gamma-glutamyltransferase [Turneriella sp.]